MIGFLVKQENMGAGTRNMPQDGKAHRDETRLCEDPHAEEYIAATSPWVPEAARAGTGKQALPQKFPKEYSHLPYCHVGFRLPL